MACSNPGSLLLPLLPHRGAALTLATAAALLSPGAQAAAFAPAAPAAPAPAGTAVATPTPVAPATATSATALASASGTPPRRTLWLCSLSERLTQLLCVADTDQAEAGDAADGGDDTTPPPATAQVRGTRFPLDPRQLWVVDLWTPPSTATDVAVLARATICYRSAHCEVRLNLPDLRGSGGSASAQQVTQRWRSR